ncbi:fimbrial protein [Providencia stuartii]|uniref:fimbrial protein n=1 Tax=Providencia stuartii TaxID=588 RepID=UPI0024AB1328|nr:fimbrial protein [Providencia stuartii]MCX3071375.1 fimbrial protein [Providencia stuartii]
MSRLKSIINKKHLLILSFFIGYISSIWAQNSVTLNFSGNISDKGCVLDNDNISVKLLDISKGRLTLMKETEYSEFKIKLSSCPSSSFNITFSANNPVIVGATKFIPTQGDTGMLLSLFDENKHPIILDESILGTVAPELTFYVKGVISNPEDVNPGDYSGQVSFVINYN